MRQEQTGLAGKSIGGGISYPAPAGERRRARGNVVFAMEKRLLSRMMSAIGNPPVQVVLWDGQGISVHGENAIARVLIHDRGALLKLVTDPELYFGELYSARRVEVQGNLLDFLEAIYRVWPLQSQGTIGKKLLAPFYDVRRNTIPGARRNICHHYDIGNDFYRLWLDERMVYTCAYFPSQSASLEDAQSAKLDLQADQSAFEAAQLMRQHHVGDVVAVEERGGLRVPVGIVTDRDLVVEIVAPGLDPAAITVGDIMAPELATVAENIGVFEAIQYMRAKGVRRLPVVDGRGGLVGILTLDDLLELLADELIALVRLVKREQRKEMMSRH